MLVITGGQEKAMAGLEGICGETEATLLLISSGLFYYFMCMNISVYVHACTPSVCLLPVEVRRRHRSPGIGVTGEPPCGSWESNLGHLQEQQVLLTIWLSSQRSQALTLGKKRLWIGGGSQLWRGQKARDVARRQHKKGQWYERVCVYPSQGHFCFVSDLEIGSQSVVEAGFDLNM